MVCAGVKWENMRHPWLRRLTWNPLLAGAGLAYFVCRTAISGVTTARIMGLVVFALWFALSLIDYFTNHKYLDWLYSDDDANPKR
jgi:hypothetical protein